MNELQQIIEGSKPQSPPYPKGLIENDTAEKEMGQGVGGKIAEAS